MTDRLTLERVISECLAITPDPKTGCRIRPATRNYPRVKVAGRKIRCSRIILENTLGRKIKPGYLALHTCDNKACVEPNHIYEGTHKQNVQDALSRQRYVKGLNHPARINPEYILRGDDHPVHKNPSVCKRGDDHYTRTNPELVKRGSNNGFSKLTESEVIDIRRKSNCGISQRQLAREFNVSQTVIWSIVKGLSWTHVKE